MTALSSSLLELFLTMPTTMNLSDCQFEHSIGSIVNYWWYAIQVHAAYVVLGGVPLGGLLFYVVTSTSSWCSSPTMRRLLSVLVAVAAAASVPLYWNYYSKKLITTADDADHDYDDRGGIRWMGPFLASTFGFSTFFKAINAGFQQYPSGADANLWTWLCWFALLPEPQFTKGKLSKASAKEITVQLETIGCKILSLFLLLTYLRNWHHYDSFQLNDGNNDKQSTYFGLPYQYWHGMLHIWLIYLFASFCEDFSILMNLPLTKGARWSLGFDNPMLASRTFAEAWGVRWNLPVQILLKRTIYVPARRSLGLSKEVSIVLTFLGSGLLHEYNFWIHNHRGYQPGRATVFFVGMSFVMMVDASIRSRILLPASWQSATDRIPSVVIAAALTFSVSGIFSSFFIQSWLEAGFFESTLELFPHLVCVHHSS